MKTGDRIRIKDINKMWDKEIYLNGYGLSDKEDLEDLGCDADFVELDFFDTGDNGVIVYDYSKNWDWKDSYKINLTLTDMNNKDFECHSQVFTIEELKEFCEIVK